MEFSDDNFKELLRTAKSVSNDSADDDDQNRIKADEHGAIDTKDVAFVNKILRSIGKGSQGVFVVRHPGGRMQYMLLNADRDKAIELLTRVMVRQYELKQEDEEQEK